MTRGNRGPRRLTSPPDHRESTKTSRIMGRLAAPAAVAEYLCIWIRFNGSTKKNTPSAAYKKKVIKLTATKVLDLKRPRGIIGCLLLRSTIGSAPRQRRPIHRAVLITGEFQPLAADMMKA